MNLAIFRDGLSGRPAVLKPRRGMGNGGLLLAPLLVLLLVVGIDRSWHPQRGESLHAAEMPKLGVGPRNYAQAIDGADKAVAFARERVRGGADQWLLQETLAGALMSRFRLTGNYDDLVEADRALTAARAVASAVSGPIMTEAVFAMTTHRQDRALAALERLNHAAVPTESDDLANARAIEGDVAFYRGDMAGARAKYLASEKLDGGASATYRWAVLAKAQGDFPRALSQFSKSAQGKFGVAPLAAASTTLQFGAVELARGDAAAAKRWFIAADRAFPGFWLIEAHLAQARALDGDLPGAITQMRGVAQRSGSAEAMDALAMLLRAQGIGDESRMWSARADALWRKRLSQMPEAAYGHALEHELVFGTPERALDLATLNLAARPYGESRLLMASALLMNGRTEPALDQLALAERSGWRSAPLYALRAQAFELSGRAAEAESARREAQAFNPHVFEPATALVWFSHG
jgi:tetratricopeptide (TPR) repeat protein